MRRPRLFPRTYYNHILCISSVLVEIPSHALTSRCYHQRAVEEVGGVCGGGSEIWIPEGVDRVREVCAAGIRGSCLTRSRVILLL